MPSSITPPLPISVCILTSGGDARLEKAIKSIVQVTAEGIFTTTKQLQEGENKILLIAKDLAGNETQLEITVTFKR